jgi:hypothetical protein
VNPSTWRNTKRLSEMDRVRVKRSPHAFNSV